MPISSGALGWPKSYWSPPPVDTRHKDTRVYPVSEWAQKIMSDRERKKRKKATRAIAQKAKKAKERKRKKRICLLVLLLILLALLLAVAGFLIWYFVFKDQSYMPELSCEGKWRVAFLGFKNKNGTYTCCYDIDPAAKTRVLANGDHWPSGYVINETDCKNQYARCNQVYKSHPEICTNGCSSVFVSYLVYCCLFFYLIVTLSKSK